MTVGAFVALIAGFQGLYTAQKKTAELYRQMPLIQCLKHLVSENGAALNAFLWYCAAVITFFGF